MLRFYLTAFVKINNTSILFVSAFISIFLVKTVPCCFKFFSLFIFLQKSLSHTMSVMKPYHFTVNNAFKLL